jgi:hypothetical protein
MKRIALVTCVILLLTLWAAASPATTTWDGWISDSKCGAKGASAEHAGCAKTCIAKGEKPVFVTDEGQKIVPIENPAAVNGHVGEHVKVTGTLTSNGAVHIDKVAALGN